MHNILHQQFEGREMRALERDGQPWFVLTDVCAALEIRHPATLAGRLEEDEKGVVSINTPGGPQTMMVINESGLYAAILKCKKPQARPFRKWITNEVLPAIRTTGSYTVAEQPAPALPDMNYPELSRLAGLTARAIENHGEVVKAEIRAEMDVKIGSLPATSEQQHELKLLVKQVVAGRQGLGLGNSIFAAVYRECWDACRIGSLRAMTRAQFPQAEAYLRAELASLSSLNDSGLFVEQQVTA